MLLLAASLGYWVPSFNEHRLKLVTQHLDWISIGNITINELTAAMTSVSLR